MRCFAIDFVSSIFPLARIVDLNSPLTHWSQLCVVNMDMAGVDGPSRTEQDVGGKQWTPPSGPRRRTTSPQPPSLGPTPRRAEPPDCRRFTVPGNLGIHRGGGKTLCKFERADEWAALQIAEPQHSTQGRLKGMISLIRPAEFPPWDEREGLWECITVNAKPRLGISREHYYGHSGWSLSLPASSLP